MAHNVEPMDLDSIDCDFDNKENSFHHNNVLRCTEKGYEELDVSELNMKLRYSITPAASPMSKSYTYCADNCSLDSVDSLNCTTKEGNLTRSYNSTLTKSDNVNKVKSLPLQSLSKDQILDGNRNTCNNHPLDTTENLGETTITINENYDENHSLPSSSSSAAQTPEATTPIKDIPKDGGSPIMRGLKSVLNMFRPSTSPIPPVEDNSNSIQTPGVSPDNINHGNDKKFVVSTPISVHKNKDRVFKGTSPLKESIVFNDEIEKELLWKDETTIFFSHEKIPAHKLFLLQGKTEKPKDVTTKLDSTVEYMDISYNNSQIDKTMADALEIDDHVESDGEFVDCETTFRKSGSPARNNIDQLDKIAGRELVSCNTNATMEQLVKQASKVILNITVPETDDIKINNILEGSSSNMHTEIKEDNSNASINIDHVQIQSNNMIFKSVNNMSEDSNLVIEHNKVGKSDQYQPSKEVSLDSIEVNFTETIVVDSNIPIDHLPMEKNVMSETCNLIKDSVDVIKNSILESGPDDNLAPNYDADSLEPNTKSVNLKINTDVAVDENIQTDSNKSKSGAAVEAAPCKVEDGPADIPLPDDEEFDKLSLTINNTTDIDKQNLNNDVVNSINLPCAHLEDEVLSTLINKNNANAQTDLINQSDLSQILNDIDAILKTAELQTEDTLAAIDRKELQADLSCNMENSLKLEFQNLTMDICDSVMRLEAIPDILNHRTTLSNLENENTGDINSTALSNKANYDNTEYKDSKNLLLDKSVDGKSELNDQVSQQLTTSIKYDIVSDVKDDSIEDLNKVNDTSIHGSIIECNEYVQDIFNEAKISPRSFIANLNKFHENQVQENNNCNDGKEENNTQNNHISTKTEHKCNEKDENEETPKTINKEIIHNSNLIQNTEIVDTENYNKTLELNRVHVPFNNTINENQVNVAILNQNTQNLESCESDSKFNITHTVEITKSLDEPVINTMEKLFNEPIVNETQTNFGNQTFTQEIKENISNTDNEQISNSILINKEINLSQGTDFKQELNKDENLKHKDEELIISGNSSPYVSVAANLDIVSDTIIKENMNLNNDSNIEIKVSELPLSSPPIVSKGYSFKFDEMDDPFATKTKTRQESPFKIPESAKEIIEEQSELNKGLKQNTRRSEPQTKKPVNKRKLNATFVDKKQPRQNTKNNSEIKTEVVISALHLNSNKDETVNQLKNSDEVSSNAVVASDTECVHLLEQSKYKSYNDVKLNNLEQYSTELPPEEVLPVENVKSRNVFNIPEIDDINFNPFATKTKIKQSPPPDTFNPFATRTKIASSPNSSIVMTTNDTIVLEEVKSPIDKMDTELMEKESMTNTSTATWSSKTTDDKDITVREMHTEDEDTEEGPVLDVEDNDEKNTNFADRSVDMMQFPEFPPQEQENAETGELFIDAEAFEFLLNKNATNIVSESGKESLFLKFDPLFAKRISSEGVFAALSKIQKPQNTPSKLTQTKIIPTSPSTSQATNIAVEMKPVTEVNNEDQNNTVSKPMMVVTPAVNPVPLPRKSITPTHKNRRSLTFTSPAMAVIDRLLSMSANNSLLDEDMVSHVSQEQHEADIALTQLRELLAEKEIHVYNLRLESKDLRERLSTMETQMKSLETEGEERLRKINELNEKLLEKSKINKSMAAVVEEYERTIASLIAETEQDKKKHAEERRKLINERDEQTAHLSSMEVSFNDLHMKYEKSKQVIMTYKANEEAYRKSLKEFEENLTKMQNNYELLKQHATSKLNHANQELEKMNRAHEAEVLKLNAMIKRKELHITSLEETLAQKTKANEELTAICDELINKVG